jgi:hypothetical protein
MSTPGNPPVPPAPYSAPLRMIANVLQMANAIGNAVSNVNEKNLGVKGAVGIDTGAGAVTGNFFALQAIGDTVLTAYAGGPTDTGVTMAGLTLPSGIVVYGNFTSVTVTSGYIRAYNK